jgi:hypothetical protein
MFRPLVNRPRSFWIQITEATMWSAPTETGMPYNFCFIKFSPSQMVEATEAGQTPIRASLTLGVGVWGWKPAMNPALRSIHIPNFIEICPMAWISLADTHTHTQTHTHTLTLYIYIYIKFYRINLSADSLSGNKAIYWVKYRHLIDSLRGRDPVV